MTALGDLLELLHSGDQFMTSFRGEFKDWAHPAPSNALVVDYLNLEHKQMRWVDSGPFPRATVLFRRVWFKPPSLMRVELISDDSILRVAVCNGVEWWRWDRTHDVSDSGHAFEGTQRNTPPLLDPVLLTPASLVARFRFVLAGEAEHLGRPVLRTEARSRIPFPGSDKLTFQFDLDAQFGTVMRRAVYESGRAIQSSELTAATFNHPIDAETFSATTHFVPKQSLGPAGRRSDIA